MHVNRIVVARQARDVTMRVVPFGFMNSTLDERGLRRHDPLRAKNAKKTGETGLMY